MLEVYFEDDECDGELAAIFTLTTYGPLSVEFSMGNIMEFTDQQINDFAERRSNALSTDESNGYAGIQRIGDKIHFSVERMFQHCKFSILEADCGDVFTSFVKKRNEALNK